jgi:hypothetical protein
MPLDCSFNPTLLEKGGDSIVLGLPLLYWQLGVVALSGG